MPSIRDAIVELTPWLIKVRRELHRVPEVMYKEYNTSGLVNSILSRNGYSIYEGFGKTGLAALWDSGRPGPTAAFRADMDGLEITEPDGCPFASANKGVMHACGHDLHMTLLLGLARLAAEGGLDLPGGRLMFIAQPAEEGGGGAAAMLRDGLFEKVARPDLIFASHADPLRPPGHLMVNSGPIMAGVLDFIITVSGRGGHAGTPKSALNPLPWLARLIADFADFTPPDDALITVTMVRGGERTNVIPPEASFSGTLRWHSPAGKAKVVDFVNLKCAEAEKIGRVKVELKWVDGYPPTVNHPGAAALVRQVGEGLFAPGLTRSEKPSFGGEDFAYFLEKVPGAYFYLGTGGPGFDAPLHSPNFRINEEALPLSLEFWARLAEKALAALSSGDFESLTF